MVTLVSGCYNGEQFIHRCFQSVLEQTYHNIEFIFVDDGSRDNSLEVAKSFEDDFLKRDFLFKIISQENMGFYPQTGIKNCSGKYISTLDIDDILLHESIEERVFFLEGNPDFAAVRTNGYFVAEENIDASTGLFVTEAEEKENTEIFDTLLLGKTNNWAGSYMVRASELFRIYPDKTVPMNRFGQNLQILMPVCYGNKTGFIDKPLMKYVKHVKSFTSSQNGYEVKKRQLEEFKKIRQSVLETLNINEPKRLDSLDRAYEVFFLNLAYFSHQKEDFNNLFKRIRKPTGDQKIMFAEINGNIFSSYMHRLLRKFIDK